MVSKAAESAIIAVEPTVQKGNYERLFDEARRKVRNWDKENGK